MASPVKLAHIVYMTRRFDQMIARYENVFEARIVHQNPALAFLTYDDEHLRSAFANPVGVVIDPDDLLARYKAGAGHGELLAMPDGPASPIPDAHGLS